MEINQKNLSQLLSLPLSCLFATCVSKKEETWCDVLHTSYFWTHNSWLLMNNRTCFCDTAEDLKMVMTWTGYIDDINSQKWNTIECRRYFVGAKRKTKMLCWHKTEISDGSVFKFSIHDIVYSICLFLFIFCKSHVVLCNSNRWTVFYPNCHSVNILYLYKQTTTTTTTA